MGQYSAYHDGASCYHLLYAPVKPENLLLLEESLTFTLPRCSRCLYVWTTLSSPSLYILKVSTQLLFSPKPVSSAQAEPKLLPLSSYTTCLTPSIPGRCSFWDSSVCIKRSRNVAEMLTGNSVQQLSNSYSEEWESHVNVIIYCLYKYDLFLARSPTWLKKKKWRGGTWREACCAN